MSPKKKVKPGRRRGPTPRRSGPEAAALREAPALLAPTATRLHAELFAAHVLGAAWADARLGADPDAAAARSLVAEARRRPGPAAAAALAAAALVSEDAEVHAALGELDEPLPGWAGTDAPALRRAEHVREDPFREREAWLLHYDDVTVMVAYDHRTGLPLVALACVLPEAGDDLRAGIEDTGATVADVPVDRAVAEVRAAVLDAERTWPREVPSSYVEHRLLVNARLRALPPSPERPDPLPEDERDRLTAAFLGPDASQAEQYAVSLFLTYGAGHLREPLLWGPTDVEMFLLDWVPGRVVLDDADRRALPEVLQRWVPYALTEAGVTDVRWHDEVESAVQVCLADFEARYGDTSASPLGELGRLLAGLDPGVTEPPRPLVAQPPAPGSAVRLTLTLLDVAPPVWRRLVVPADVSLARLHRCVQAAMGWTDAHSHEWEVAGERVRGAAEDQLRLTEVVTRTDRISYTYDFGDDWRHELRLEHVLPPADAGDVPRLEAGERACPPEDVGGGVGYSLLLDAYASDDIDEDDQLVDPFGEVWSPDRFDAGVADAWLRSC